MTLFLNNCHCDHIFQEVVSIIVIARNQCCYFYVRFYKCILYNFTNVYVLVSSSPLPPLKDSSTDTVILDYSEEKYKL